MPLTLSIRNADSLENGSPTSLVLDRRGAIIGRAPTVDWSLPDPQMYISSRHCEVSFTDGTYVLIDHSTNGTFLLGETSRLAGPRMITQGDVFLVGNFEIEARLDDAAAAEAASRTPPPQVTPEWKGWAAAAGPSPAQSADKDDWGQSQAPSGWGPSPASPPPPSPPSGGWGPASDPRSGGESSNWGPAPESPGNAASSWSPAPPPAPAAPSRWDVAPPPPAASASNWSDAPTPSSSGASDIWGKFAQSNVVDWARGGFGDMAAATHARRPPPPAASVASANFTPPATAESRPPSPEPPGPGPVPPPNVPEAQSGAEGGTLDKLARAAGIDPAQFHHDETETARISGYLLNKLVAGLVVMLEARARAKSQMGAAGTSLELDGNNPLKFARSPEQALTQLLNPPQRGFLPADRAIEDAFKDLQAHQMATLMAMQGALRATLDRFSPTAIRSRIEEKGILSKVVPGARDAALWKAYEREFSGVAQGSDEAFMDMFAKEFRRAYEEISRDDNDH